MKSVGLYIHIPFCRGKCSYCSFVSSVKDEGYIARYTTALRRELEYVLSKEMKVDTLYIGGGTPSAIGSEEIERIVDTIKKHSVYAPREFTIECNPESIDDEKLAVYKRVGASRISVGVQSLSDRVLKSVGRLHDSKTAIEAVSKAVKYGFDVSVDMILGLPGSTFEDIDTFVDTFSDIGVDHISAYALKVEEGTCLFKEVESGKTVILDDDAMADQYDRLQEKALSCGYRRYEVSNFAKENKESLHNMKYWEMDEYIGIGASAHSYFASKRYYNVDDVDRYIENVENGIFIEEKEEDVVADTLFEETLMLGLRLEKGVALLKLDDLIGGSFVDKYRGRIDKARGFIDISNGRIAIKPTYMPVMNSIIIKLLYD